MQALNRIVKRFRNILLVLICGARFLVRGKANNAVLPPRRILIIQLAKLGDMICTTPLFRSIKRKYPEAEITVLGDAVNKEALRGNPDVDSYIVYEKKIWRLLGILRKQRFDFGCVTGPGPEALAILYLSAIPAIAAPVIENGISPQETKAYRLLRRLVISVPHRMRHYAAREYLRLLRPLKIESEDTTKHLFFSSEAEAKVLRVFGEYDVRPDQDFLVGIFPSTGHKIKRWEPERFARVAEHIGRTYKAVLCVVGTEGDREEIERMQRALASDVRAIILIGAFSVEELKAFISHLSLFISVDTGPIYIAEALGIPTVDIVGPVDEKEQPPCGRIHRIVKSDREKPELFVMNSSGFDESEAKRQSAAISVEMVNAAVDELISSLKLR